MADLIRQLMLALNELSPERRQAVVLTYWGGLSNTEIASLYALPLGTVKSRCRDSLRYLRTSMETHTHEGVDCADPTC